MNRLFELSHLLSEQIWITSMIRETMRIYNDCDITLIKYRPKFSTLCTIGKSPFSGTILIEFEPDKYLLEFEAFEVWVYEHSTKSYTVESYARLVYDMLQELLSPKSLIVVVDANTIKHGNVSATISSLA